MRERDFPWPGNAASADQPDVADGMVRGAERPLPTASSIGESRARGGMYAKDLEELLRIRPRQDGRDTFRDEGFARARRPNHQ